MNLHKLTFASLLIVGFNAMAGEHLKTDVDGFQKLSANKIFMKGKTVSVTGKVSGVEEMSLPQYSDGVIVGYRTTPLINLGNTTCPACSYFIGEMSKMDMKKMMELSQGDEVTIMCSGGMSEQNAFRMKKCKLK